MLYKGAFYLTFMKSALKKVLTKFLCNLDDNIMNNINEDLFVQVDRDNKITHMS